MGKETNGVRDVEFQEQVIEARPGTAYRKAAEARKENFNRQREVFFRTLEQEADQFNVEFYGEALAWQYKHIALASAELVGNMV